jgi:hypothetical protein
MFNILLCSSHRCCFRSSPQDGGFDCLNMTGDDVEKNHSSGPKKIPTLGTSSSGALSSIGAGSKCLASSGASVVVQ